MLNEAERSGNVSQTAKPYGLKQSEIRRWRKIIKKTKQFPEKSATRVIIHRGQKLENSNLQAPKRSDLLQ